MLFCDLKIQYARIGDKIKKNIENVLNSGAYIMGPEVKEIESVLSKYCGVKHAISCANGTDALTLAMLAFGLKAGDEIITPAFTYFATAEAAAIVGIKPIFVDIELNTYNTNYKLIESKITSKTKAIMHVSLFGQCCDIDEINKIAKKHNLFVIEDAAQSMGAEYKGKKSCSFDGIASTSFYPSKTLGAYGDGGMMFTNDDNLAERLRSLRIHGQGALYKHDLIGINSRLDTIQAAILLAKMEIFDEEMEMRRDVCKYYDELIGDALVTPFISEFNLSVYAQYVLRAKTKEQREKIISGLKEKGIPTMIYYPMPLPAQKAMDDYCVGINKEAEFPNSCLASDTVFSLPMHPYLKKSDQEMIVSEMKKLI